MNGQVLADLDGDGDLDLAVVSAGVGAQDKLQIYANDGSGSFTFVTSFLYGWGTSPHNLAAADFDGDGNIDLAVTLKNANAVFVAFNAGGFSFNQGAIASTGGVEPRHVTAADMDGDGDPDLVVSNRATSDIGVILNTAGSFTLLGAFPAGDDIRGHAVADFDGDGLLDVVASSHDDRTMTVLTNLGGGSLSAPVAIDTPHGTRPEDVVAVDIDGDGDSDVVAATADSTNVARNSVSIYTNVGGVLTGPVAVSTGGLDTRGLTAADLDGDGDMDVVTANQGTDNLSVLTNTGGGLAVTLQIPLAQQPRTVLGGDLDGNGSIDLTANKHQQANISIYLNQASGSPGTFENYCVANPNSSGLGASMAGIGSLGVAANALAVECSSMPVNTVGFFLVSRDRGFTVNPGGSQGNLCLGGSIGRYQALVRNSGAAGAISIPIDVTAIPTPTGNVAVIAGDTWHFQCWFRDSVGGVTTSNLSDGLSATFVN